MDAWLTLQTAFRALARNKIRTALTMLGIIIGIASVIAMVAMGEGASRMIQNQMNAMGRNLLMVFPGAASTGGLSMGAGTGVTLTPEDGDAIAREVIRVRAVSPMLNTRVQVVYGSRNWVPNRLGGYGADYLKVKDWPMESGDFFTASDVAGARKVCVVGLTVVENLFDGDPPVGKILRIKNMPFQVLGVLTRKGISARGDDQDDSVIVPWTTVRTVLQGSSVGGIDGLLVSAVTDVEMPAAVQEITALLRQRHRLSEKEADDFRILSMTEMVESASATARIMTLLLAVIASISLLVGGIGIMNIMLVAVAERTREIGLRMAVGARGRDILLQFLAESVVLSVTAGLIGMGLGAASAMIISSTLRWPTVLTPASIGASFLFSCGVGVFFGLYPALRASRLNPIEALRYE